MSWPMRPNRTERFEEYVTAYLPSGACLTATPLGSDVEEHGFALALKADVEHVDDCAVALLALGDQRLAPHRRLDHVQHRVLRVRRGFVSEVHARGEPDVDAASRKPQVDVRRHRLAPGPARDPARLDSLERVNAGLEVGPGPAPAAEPLVDRLVAPPGRGEGGEGRRHWP